MERITFMTDFLHDCKVEAELDRKDERLTLTIESYNGSETSSLDIKEEGLHTSGDWWHSIKFRGRYIDINVWSEDADGDVEINLYPTYIDSLGNEVCDTEADPYHIVIQGK